MEYSSCPAPIETQGGALEAFSCNHHWETSPPASLLRVGQTRRASPPPVHNVLSWGALVGLKN
ncbi:hypothetical protein D4764_09G0001880 [Takifugu flavidus]|uniref:Uncharacterized protein n=1 Tax=Takifugu flavidus TaxID=433684 RepID=A0A5C6MK10_9TELE|nr:hypothetical protein D4764_09G0001880 [Takifugu flavidus]